MKRKYPWDLETAPRLDDYRPKADFGTLLSLVSQRQNALNQWSNAGVKRVAKQARQAERVAKQAINNNVSIKRKNVIGIRPNNTFAERNNTTAIYKQPQVKQYKISDENLAKLNLAERKAKVRSYNANTPGEYAPDGYTMGRLGFTYSDNTHTKYQYKENNKKVYQCAYTANRLSSRFRRPTAGNAWTTQGIFGDSVLVDGYNQGINVRPLFYNHILVDAYNRRAANYVKRHINEHNLQNGDIVGMYTAFSP